MSVDDDFERMSQILAPGKSLEEPPEVNSKTLKKYYQFLQRQLPRDVLMTGRESMGYFGWEERFEWGPGNEGEYRQLIQENASYKDQFKFVSVHQDNEYTGVYANVIRISDHKTFHIPLEDLEVCDEKIAQWQVIEDYAAWFVNFGGDEI